LLGTMGPGKAEGHKWEQAGYSYMYAGHRGMYVKGTQLMGRCNGR